MELRDLLVIDAESLSAAQAKQVAGDVIATLAAGVEARHQPKLRSLLISAQEKASGRKLGDSTGDTRSVVLQKINEADERGDKRTARYLMESMAQSDADAADLADRKAASTIQKFIEDDIAASEAARKKQQEELIRIRTQDIWHAHGWEITEEQARKQATAEIAGRPAYEDDINGDAAA